MATALSSLPPKLIRLTAGTPPQEIKPEAGDLAARVSMVKLRLAKAAFTSQGDAKLVPKLYEDYVKSIVGVLQMTLALAGAEAPPLSLPALPSVELPLIHPVRLADQQLLLCFADADNEGVSQLGEVQGGHLQLLIAGDNTEAVLDRCSQVVLPWRPPTKGWAAAFLLQLKKLVDLKQRKGAAVVEKVFQVEKAIDLNTKADALSMEIQGISLEEVSAAMVTKIEQKVSVLVPALQSSQSNHARIQEEADHIKIGVVRVLEIEALIQSLAELKNAIQGAGQEQQEGRLEGLLWEVKKHASETARRVVEVPAAALRATGAAGERRYGSGQWLTVRQPDDQWADIQVTTDDASPNCAGLELLHPWNHAPRELPQQEYEIMRDWWLKTLVAKHSDITDALTGKRLDVLQQCVAINLDGAESATVHDASSLSKWLHNCHADRCKGGAVDTPAAALLTGPPAAGKTSLVSQVCACASYVSPLLSLLNN